MSHHHQEQQTGLDRRFFHLLRWELHHLRGRRRGVWWVVSGLLGLAFAVVVWWAASRPMQVTGKLAVARAAAIAFLIATPIRDEVADVSQLTFGYDLLRFASYILIAIAKVMLPGLVAGIVAGDRRTGRLQDVQLTTFAPREIYLAKVLASALPFLLPGVLLLTLFSGIVISEYVPVSEVARLCLEAVEQVLLLAFITVTCSALFSSTWAAMVVAYLLLWLALPLYWLILLTSMDRELYYLLIDSWMTLSGKPQSYGLGVQFAVQTVLTMAVCLVAFVIGAVKLHPYGFWSVVRRRLRSRQTR